MRRFAVLRHTEAKGDRHFDIFLECDGALLSFKTAELQEPYEAFEVVRQFDHRLLYLDYEGEISNDRGFVERVDSGLVETAAELTVAGSFSARFHGHLLIGNYKFEVTDKGYQVRRLYQ